MTSGTDQELSNGELPYSALDEVDDVDLDEIEQMACLCTFKKVSMAPQLSHCSGRPKLVLHGVPNHARPSDTWLADINPEHYWDANLMSQASILIRRLVKALREERKRNS